MTDSNAYRTESRGRRGPTRRSMDVAERLIQIRLMGPGEVVDQVAEQLQAVRGLSVVQVSRPRANRSDDGVRRYLTAFAEERSRVG